MENPGWEMVSVGAVAGDGTGVEGGRVRGGRLILYRQRSKGGILFIGAPQMNRIEPQSRLSD